MATASPIATLALLGTPLATTEPSKSLGTIHYDSSSRQGAPRRLKRGQRRGARRLGNRARRPPTVVSQYAARLFLAVADPPRSAVLHPAGTVGTPCYRGAAKHSLHFESHAHLVEFVLASSSASTAGTRRIL